MTSRVHNVNTIGLSLDHIGADFCRRSTLLFIVIIICFNIFYVESTDIFGTLNISEPLINPRRGSATGSYGLPVPPEWLRSQAEGRRSSKPNASGRNSPSGPWPPQRTSTTENLPGKIEGKISLLPMEQSSGVVINGHSKDRGNKVKILIFNRKMKSFWLYKFNRKFLIPELSPKNPSKFYLVHLSTGRWQVAFSFDLSSADLYELKLSSLKYCLEDFFVK